MIPYFYNRAPEKKCLLRILPLAFIFLLFINTHAFGAEHKYTIYFYNPETNINNFASLKKEFDLYLSQFGGYQFQPFSEREMFEKLIANKKDGIFIISSWHYKKLKERIPIEPVMVAIAKNKPTCRRIFSTNRTIDDIKLLTGMNVASASSEDYTKSVLVQMFGENNGSIATSIKILSVPKDIDALMSVGFGMADGAITTDNSLAKLAAINRKLHDKLKQLLISDETLLPIVAIPKLRDENHLKLTKIIKDMETAVEGKNKLNMLGFEGWKTLNESEKEYLGE
ncbi:MAG: phosphate/phosphite/phosphonate ABC transporter substrate-binding protein [Candidatus Kuenenia sp.]|nr:phosphate/phosphite/phosphonate ABC transporter substrate-binding protein [Candidatus Kuenenia hertensis]